MDHEKTLHTVPALTGIRAIAVYLVYLHHVNPFDVERFGIFVHNFVDQFHVGVNIFFVLSGFLITLRYYESSALKKHWLKKYFQNRIARVYPMYFILTTVTLIVFSFQGRLDENLFFTYFMNISFLRGFFDDLKFSLIGQGWSLTVEECFYMVAPLLFIGFRKSKWSLLFFIVLFIAIGCGLVVAFSDLTFYGFFKNYSFLFTYTFFGRCAEFLMGAGIVILFHSQLRKEKKGVVFTLLGAVISVILVIAMTKLNTAENAVLERPVMIVINNFLLPAAISLLFYGLIREESLLKKILGSTPFVILGKSSYTFYLIHVGVFYSLLNSYLPNDFLVTFLLINLISLGLWYTVEEPLNRLVRGL